MVPLPALQFPFRILDRFCPPADFLLCLPPGPGGLYGSVCRPLMFPPLQQGPVVLLPPSEVRDRSTELWYLPGSDGNHLYMCPGLQAGPLHLPFSSEPPGRSWSSGLLHPQISRCFTSLTRFCCQIGPNISCLCSDKIKFRCSALINSADVFLRIVSAAGSDPIRCRTSGRKRIKTNKNGVWTRTFCVNAETDLFSLKEQVLAKRS